MTAEVIRPDPTSGHLWLHGEFKASLEYIRSQINNKTASQGNDQTAGILVCYANLTKLGWHPEAEWFSNSHKALGLSSSIENKQTGIKKK